MTSVDDAVAPAVAAAIVADAGEVVAAEVDDGDCRVHRLRTPLIRNGERIVRIRLRPPTLGDIDDWSNGELSNRELLARLAEQAPATLKALVWDDAEAVMTMFHQVVPEFVFAAPKGDA